MGTAKSRWSYSTGEKGRNRVRAFQHSSGVLMLEFYERQRGGDAKRVRLSLGHRDQAKAKQQADDAAAKLGRVNTLKPDELTLRELFDIYGDDVTPTKHERTQRHDGMASRLFLQAFGESRDPRTLDRRDWDRFIRDRLSGRLHPSGRKQQVGPRTVQRDLKWLLAVLNWATVAGDGRGNALLERNPLRGLALPREKNPARPTISQERYIAMLQVAADIDWRFGVALMLAHETGHRIGAIRQLRWDDVDLEVREITWPESTEKTGYAHTTAITPDAVAALKRARERNPGIGAAWVLPEPRDASTPCSRFLVNSWWEQAELKAGLDAVPGLRWHSLRRKFATDLKNVPLPDLCALGGWKTSHTILECYQQPDAGTQRKALEERRSSLQPTQATDTRRATEPAATASARAKTQAV